MFEEVFDLYCNVVGELRELLMQIRYNSYTVRRPIEEIGISEGDVLCPVSHLASDVLKDNVPLHYPKCTVVDGNNGAMAAKVLAAAGGFSISNRSCSARSHLQSSVMLQSRQVAAIRYQKSLPR